jgi:hypothetical protein
MIKFLTGVAHSATKFVASAYSGTKAVVEGVVAGCSLLIPAAAAVTKVPFVASAVGALGVGVGAIGETITLGLGIAAGGVACGLGAGLATLAGGVKLGLGVLATGVAAVAGVLAAPISLVISAVGKCTNNDWSPWSDFKELAKNGIKACWKLIPTSFVKVPWGAFTKSPHIAAAAVEGIKKVVDCEKFRQESYKFAKENVWGMEELPTAAFEKITKPIAEAAFDNLKNFGARFLIALAELTSYPQRRSAAKEKKAAYDNEGVYRGMPEKEAFDTRHKRLFYGKGGKDKWKEFAEEEEQGSFKHALYTRGSSQSIWSMGHQLWHNITHKEWLWREDFEAGLSGTRKTVAKGEERENPREERSQRTNHETERENGTAVDGRKRSTTVRTKNDRSAAREVEGRRENGHGRERDDAERDRERSSEHPRQRERSRSRDRRDDNDVPPVSTGGWHTGTQSGGHSDHKHRDSRLQSDGSGERLSARGITRTNSHRDLVSGSSTEKISI